MLKLVFQNESETESEDDLDNTDVDDLFAVMSSALSDVDSSLTEWETTVWAAPPGVRG